MIAFKFNSNHKNFPDKGLFYNEDNDHWEADVYSFDTKDKKSISIPSVIMCQYINDNTVVAYLPKGNHLNNGIETLPEQKEAAQVDLNSRIFLVGCQLISKSIDNLAKSKSVPFYLELFKTANDIILQDNFYKPL